jgi:hypothetical protein
VRPVADDRDTTVADPAANAARSRFATLASAYYLLATPIFAVLDYVAHANIRVTFLDGHPAIRALYYAIVLACGVVVLARPRLAPVVGVTESAANIGFLIIGVFVAYLGMLDDAGGPGDIANPFTPRAIVNLVISATWGYASYANAVRRMGRGL